MSTRRFRDRLILLAFILVLLIFGGLVVRKFIHTSPPSQPPASVPSSPRQLREVVLYFGSQEGPYLVAEAREIADCLEDIECIRETVQALVNGPVGDLVPIFPEHAVVRDVREADGTAFVDFSREVMAAHPGGSISELLTVYGLADTLAVNFPYIRQVRILVEGEEVDTLKGHVDLSQPVKADFRYTRPPEGGERGSRPAAGGETQ